MSACRHCQPQKADIVRLLPSTGQGPSHKYATRWHVPGRSLDDSHNQIPPVLADQSFPAAVCAPAATGDQQETDPLYLFACHAEWERRADPGSAWELLSAANSTHEDTRAHARSLLAHSGRIQGREREPSNTEYQYQRRPPTEVRMKTPYGLEIIESCVGCKLSRKHFFCAFSPAVLRSLDISSHHSILPGGALLFVEGQAPRGIFILCSGKVTLSTTSKEGKVLILKQAEAGEVLGLSATVCGLPYEMTAETETPCQVNFINRTSVMNLLQCESEVGVHATQWLSRDFQAAYRDIHDLVLARSSAGKLAKLLLSCAPAEVEDAAEF